MTQELNPESTAASRQLADGIADLLRRTLKFRDYPGREDWGLEVGEHVRAANPDDGLEFTVIARNGAVVHVDVYPGRTATCPSAHCSHLEAAPGCDGRVQSNTSSHAGPEGGCDR